MRVNIVIGLLCVYAFIKEFRPSEPFLTSYLTSPLKNFNNDELSQEIYPVTTYSSFLFMIPLFLLTDPLRYKILILFESLSYASCWALLLWADTVELMQVMQFFYGVARASEVSFYAYTYAVVSVEKYQRVTSWVRSSLLLGDFFSYGLSQLLVSVFSISYLTLNIISFVSMCIIIVIALCLPWISWKKDKHLIALQNTVCDNPLPKTYIEYVTFYFNNVFHNFKAIYSSSLAWKWSLWWALASCGYFQIGGYTQNLWYLMQPADDPNDIYNGVVECINTFLSATVVFAMQFLHVRWEIWGELTLAITAALNCIVLLIMSQTTILVLSYCCYSLTRVMYQLMISIAMYNIAKVLKTEIYGLVFGFNTFMALCIQTILTIVVASNLGLHLYIRTQFVVYGAYYGCTGFIFFVMGFLTIRKNFDGNTGQFRLNDDKEDDQKTEVTNVSYFKNIVS